jgi:uncharacterized protein YbaP (TraB family)
MSNSILWELRSPEHSEPSYLLGSMHARDSRAFQYESLFERHIAACEGFATELNLDEKLNFHPQLQASFLLPAGMQLQELIGERKYSRLKRILQKAAGIQLDMFRLAQPSVVLNMASEAMLRQEMALPLDQHLWEIAKEKDKKRKGIESWEEQMAVASQMSMEDQVKALLAFGRNISRYRKEMRRLADLYAAGDIRRIYQIGKRSMGKSRRIFIYQRNYIMADRIAEMIALESWFVAIGAGHLSGAKGVLRLLKHKEISLKPVPLKK